MNIKEAAAFISENLTSTYSVTEIRGLTTLIIEYLTRLNRSQQMLDHHQLLSESSKTQIYDIIKQLQQFVPIQYILGTCWFYDLIFEVNPSVLIPRPETEELVDWILKDNKLKTPNVLDIGTGSGCIAISLAHNIDGAIVSAFDISDAALIVAQKNAKRNQTNVKFSLIDILHHDPSGFFDIIVSNPPYVTLKQKEEMLQNVLDHEPHLALFVPEKDPLLFYRAITCFASKTLLADGILYLEINEDLSSETEQLVASFGFKTELKKDLNGRFRMLKAIRND